MEALKTVRRWRFLPSIPRLSSTSKLEVHRVATGLEALSALKA
jgi:outer membrane biosynthesis protein TonB